MPTYRGFVETLESRSDGWVELTLCAAHSGGQRRTFLIPNLDGDLEKTNRRLAQLGLARDALARVLPVELQFSSDQEQGDLVDDLAIHPRPSFESRRGGRWVSGVVIGVGVHERGPENASTPYRDEADLASVTLLADDGTVEGLLIDLQRPDPGTGAALLELATLSWRTRRKVEAQVYSAFEDRPKLRARITDPAPGFVIVLRFPALESVDLDLVDAFVERITQRSASFDSSDAPGYSHCDVDITTAPEQSPIGDVSENGTFQPTTRTARIHLDHPALSHLREALCSGLAVRLGLVENQIHQVTLISPLGSAARPIWITTRREPVCEDGARPCDNVPTVRTPSAQVLDQTPLSQRWSGDGYFRAGIWRFVVESAHTGSVHLTVDGVPPACYEAPTATHDHPARDFAKVAHAYLEGLHRVELLIRDRACSASFRFAAYRIR